MLGASVTGDGNVEVQVRLRATDTDVCGDSVKQVFRATVITTRTGGRWVMRDINARRTYGQPPITDASQCASASTTEDYDEDPAPDAAPEEESAEEDSGGGCHPSYAGACVPDEGYDVDCGELAETDISVVGPDEYGLDGEGDGIACES